MYFFLFGEIIPIFHPRFPLPQLIPHKLTYRGKLRTYIRKKVSLQMAYVIRPTP